MVQVQGQQFELMEEVRNGWNEEAFKERYSDVLNKYDFVVGDWAHDQLRLRGFFDNNRKKVAYDTKIDTLQDYIYEHCNFGCPYFVLQKIRHDG